MRETTRHADGVAGGPASARLRRYPGNQKAKLYRRGALCNGSGLGRDLGRSLLNATLRDYARFGYFFMHGGKIGVASILPQGWVADASRSHIQTNYGDGYGYEWWINADGSYRAIGIFGQMVFLDPKSDVVIVTQSVWPEADWDAGYEAIGAFNSAVVQMVLTHDE